MRKVGSNTLVTAVTRTRPEGSHVGRGKHRDPTAAQGGRLPQRHIWVVAQQPHSSGLPGRRTAHAPQRRVRKGPVRFLSDTWTLEITRMGGTGESVSAQDRKRANSALVCAWQWAAGGAPPRWVVPGKAHCGPATGSSTACDEQVEAQVALGALAERVQEAVWGWLCVLEACGHGALPKPGAGRAQGPCASCCTCFVWDDRPKLGEPPRAGWLVTVPRVSDSSALSPHPSPEPVRT